MSTETRNNRGGAQLLLVLAVALGGSLMLAFWLIGGRQMRLLGLILTIAIGVSLVIASSSFPIRSWRRRDATGETHYVHDGTKTIVKETRVHDGRAIEAPKIYQLPAQAPGNYFPDLLRAAMQAGALSSRSSAVPSGEEYAEAEVHEIGPDPEGWDGDIRS